LNEKNYAAYTRQKEKKRKEKKRKEKKRKGSLAVAAGTKLAASANVK
jgi:hypothetical protein